MKTRKTRAQTNVLYRKALKRFEKGEQITKFCNELGINSGRFHDWRKKNGFTKATKVRPTKVTSRLVTIAPAQQQKIIMLIGSPSEVMEAAKGFV